MLEAASALPGQLRSLTDSMMLHRVTQTTNALVQQANRYIDAQAPWALRKTDVQRMETVLWVLLEVLRHVRQARPPLCLHPSCPHRSTTGPVPRAKWALAQELASAPAHAIRLAYQVGICSLPVTPTIASQLLDQIAVPPGARMLRDLEQGCVLPAGAQLPAPRIIVPRYADAAEA